MSRTKIIDDPEDVGQDMEMIEMNIKSISAAIMTEVVEDVIMAESADEVPVRTGTLRRSATVEDPVIDNRSVSIAFGYGTNYAVYVHENMNAKHKPPTKAKYLEDPVNRHVHDFERILADRLLRVIGLR